MATILIAEDEKNIQLLIQAQLKAFYEIIVANDGLEAMEIIETTHIDLLITDIMMPRMDGIDLVTEIRQSGYKMPIIMLTAKQTISDKRTGFHSGADDYLTKPVNYEELILRVEALMRRAHIEVARQIKIGEVILNEDTYMISKNNYGIELPKKEFALLFKLLSYPNQIFTKNQLLDEIWGFDSESGEDTIKTHISRIRKKCEIFEEFKIKTVKGLGYKGEILV
ncbi:response regulator transcription factor [Enterococcus hermanniensis]|uniref:Heme response regulator HssR n=1 Tax=Enterococcus hermanniensis TaxID=249189 RepID=A0A1L8TPL0_9ENTE|nr:response regulator transcription factor [Enterococcus hermanniensis]OJG46261.1 heme response regulator HssR [Enterococcus hermanniensis]